MPDLDLLYSDIKTAEKAFNDAVSAGRTAGLTVNLSFAPVPNQDGSTSYMGANMVVSDVVQRFPRT